MKEANPPKVGIFWLSWDGQTMYVKSVSIQDADTCEGYTDYEGSHYDEWSRATNAHPEWGGFEYDEVPRGRVVMRVAALGGREFIVYAPTVLRRFEKIIAAAFHLPWAHVQFDYSDEHYQMPDS